MTGSFTAVRRRRIDFNWVYLRNIKTGKQITVAAAKESGSGFTTFLAPGQVNGNWATWWGCVKKRCHVYRYNIATHTTTRLVNTLPNQYVRDSSIAKDGTVFFNEALGQDFSGPCGDHVKLMEQKVGQSTPTVLIRFHQGYDVDATSVDDSGGSTNVLVSKYRCGPRLTGDVYRVAVP